MIRLAVLIKRFFPLTICYLLVATFFYGCGYTTRSLLPTEIETIAIPTFTNKIDIQSPSPQYKTYYPGLEIKITNAIIERFLYDGNLRIAKEETADLILEGELIDYLRQPLRYSEAEEIEEYRLSLVVNLVLRRGKGEVLWQEENFIGDTTYSRTGSLAKTESEALDEAVEDLARRVVNRTIEGW